MARVACDAVLVASPPHHAAARAALGAGLHVLCEKPLATTLEDALDLVRVSEETGRVLMVSQNYRFNAPFRALQGAMGEIGDLVCVKLECRRDIRDLFPPDYFRYAMRHPYLLDMSVHHFDLLRAATGGDILRVHARARRVPDSPFAHHPAVTALLDLEGDVPVLYDGDRATHGPETSWNGEWEAVGERGRPLWQGGPDDRGEGEVVLERWGQMPKPPALEATERTATLLALRTSIETGAAPGTAAADNAKSLAVTLGCVRSVETGEAVDLPALLDAAGRVANADRVG
jgi:predicted dehydrogenase